MVRKRDETTAGGTLWGRVLSAFALVVCVPVGIYFVSIAVEFVGIVLGVAGYALGARRLGSLAVALCAGAMLLGLLMGQGVIPGSYDEMVNGAKEMIQDPLSGE